MAEFVELRIEETIPEVEELERLGILSGREVKKLIQKRRDFEYRLARRSKNKCDYINYINYERKLIELIRIRRQQIGVHEKRRQIESSIALRVLKHLRHLTRVWPSHLDTWALRINFSRFIGWKDEISSAYTEQIRYHGNRESVWVAWAKWEVEERRNFDRARTILLSKAPLYHPKSCLIKRELFRLELLYVELLMNKLKHDNIAGLEEVIAENREKVLNCAVAEAVYLDAVSRLPDPELYLQLYQVADKFTFAHTLRDEIYRDVCAKFPNAVCVWKLKAQRLVSGLEEVESEVPDNIGTIDKENGIIDDETIGVTEAQDSLCKASGDIRSAENKNVSEDICDEENSETKVVNTDENASCEEDDDDDVEEEEEEEEINEEVGPENRGESGSDKGEMKVEEDCEDTDEVHRKMAAISVDSARGLGEDLADARGAEESESSTLHHKNAPPKSLGKMEPQAKLESFISTFDEAIKAAGEEFVSVYIEELLPLLHQCWGVPAMTNLIFESLLRLCEENSTVLSPLHFYVWHQVLCEQSGCSGQNRTVLEEAVRHHPAAQHLQLEFVRCILREADSDVQLMKEFPTIGLSMQGECGLNAWKEAIKRINKNANRTKLFSQAMDHEDSTVASGMRVLYLQHVGLQKGIANARKLYKKMCWRPPFCGRIQAQMVELELAQVEVNAEAVRKVFDISLQQHGTKNPGVWLAYIQFEKQRGDPLRAGGLFTRAEKELEAQQAHVFRELNMTIRELLGKEPSSSGTEGHSDSVLVEVLEDEETEAEDEVLLQPGLVSLFPEELMLSHTANSARTKFFSDIHNMEKSLKKGNKKAPKGDGKEWEKVLGVLTGHKITLSVQEVKVKTTTPEDDNKPQHKNLTTPRFQKRYEPTDHLNPDEDMNVRVDREDNIEKILASSAVLKPDFMQQTRLPPNFVGKKKAKELRKREREKTKGPGWFGMKAPELTEEAKRDLEMLQMRSVLDPKRHYKNDMKVLPKYFQLGRVVDNPIDFYSSRIPKKQRKRTMAEEIMHDEETLRYQKRKYNEIITAKQKKQSKYANLLKGNKKKKVAAKE